MGLASVLMVLHFLVSVALIGVILLQRSKGEGLGSIGGGARLFFDQPRGVDKALENGTKVLAVAFVLLSIVLSVLV